MEQTINFIISGSVNTRKTEIIDKVFETGQMDVITKQVVFGLLLNLLIKNFLIELKLKYL
jgi:hypothetical protein